MTWMIVGIAANWATVDVLLRRIGRRRAARSRPAGADDLRLRVHRR